MNYNPSSNKTEEVEVSVIVPCYNEENTITLLLDALYKQTFPIGKMEVIVADGFSTDQTRTRVEKYAQAHAALKIKVVDNPKQTIPAAVNVAVQNATGEFIIRLDAHSIPDPFYVELCIQALKDGVAECVGGIWVIAPGGDGWIARSIAAAAAHPIAVGDARYRFTRQAAFVDTVPFGAFRKELFMNLGGFNERLLTNEDYEFFARIRKGNGRIWLNPSIRSIYFARKNLPALISQYWRYGFWKYKMLKEFPDTLRWRQALPPLFVFTLILLMLLSLVSKIFLWALLSILGIYIFILIAVGIKTAIIKKDLSLIMGMPLAIICMHISWGLGFLYSIIKK